MIPTDFAQLIGNDSIKSYLQKMVDSNMIANSLLFAGPEGIGKSHFAQAFAAQLICKNDPKGIHRQKIAEGNHPDIYHYRPEGKLGVHSIQSLRQLSDEVHLPPYESKWKVFIVHDADRMLTYSANALLKTFEEPPAYTIIILLSSSPKALLPTVLSRCRPIYFHAVSNHEIMKFLLNCYPQLNEEAARKYAVLSQGSMSVAKHLAEFGVNPNREQLLNILSKGNLQDYKELTNFVSELTERIEAAKKQIEKEAKEDLYKVPVENMSTQQQHALEKELEGIITMKQVQEAYALFDCILHWYRDLHLLIVGGERQYLMNLDYEEQLEQVLQKGNLISLERVRKAIAEAKLALQRSTSLQICLESLFLKLDLIA